MTSYGSTPARKVYIFNGAHMAFLSCPCEAVAIFHYSTQDNTLSYCCTILYYTTVQNVARYIALSYTTPPLHHTEFYYFPLPCYAALPQAIQMERGSSSVQLLYHPAVGKGIFLSCCWSKIVTSRGCFRPQRILHITLMPTYSDMSAA